MNKYFIDDGISNDSINQMLVCFDPKIKNYSHKDTILRYSDNKIQVGLILSGNASLHAIDIDGNDMLLETYTTKDMFGQIFYLPLDNYEYLVTAEDKCEVMFIDYNHIITPCEKVCTHHTKLISNLFMMAAERAQSLSLHLNILKQPTIQKKLITYLKYVRSVSGENPFTIPMSLSSLAQYLCIDRSAMTREIKAMNDKGIIKSHKRKFLLLNTDK